MARAGKSLIKMSKFSTNLKKFELVTFDVTDTLLKLSLPPAVQYGKTAAEFGYTNLNQTVLSKKYYTEFKKITTNYPNFGRQHNMESKSWWFQFVCNVFEASSSNHNKIPIHIVHKIALKLIEQYHTPECWEKVPGANEIVEKLKEAGKVVGVISNFDESLREIIGKMNLPRFDFILTSYECGHMKPNKKIFEEALKMSKTSQHSGLALHIGNSLENDYIGAMQAGWSSLLISKNFEIKNDLRLRNKNHVYDDLQTLLDNLEKCDRFW